MTPRKIALIGGGSLLWAFGLVRQFVDSHAMRGCRLVLMDIHAERLDLVRRAGEKYNRSHGSPIDLEVSADLDQALNGASFVLTALSTGGLDAMRHDLEVPEKYGIYHTVGDTVGPGGWLRAVRNVPVFEDIGRRMSLLCPDAWLVNMTNPLTVLTRVPQRQFGIRTVGMCPSVEEQARTFAVLAGADASRHRDFVIAGINHGSYFLDLHAGDLDVLAALEQRGFRGVDDADATLKDSYGGGLVHNRAAFTLWGELGYLPAINDRHIVENHAGLVSGPAAEGGHLSFGLIRTPIEYRAERYKTRKRQLEAYVADSGAATIDGLGHGDDPIVNVVEALCGAGGFVFCCDYMNVGQTPQAPLGAVVEMRCRFDAAGIHPLPAAFPPLLAQHLLPTVYRQEAIIDIALSGSFDDLVTLVAADPLCAHLRLGESRSMVREMLEANRHLIQNPRLLDFGDSTQAKAVTRET